MKRSKFTVQQIAFALQQAEAGPSVAEVCRRMEISEQSTARASATAAGTNVNIEAKQHKMHS